MGQAAAISLSIADAARTYYFEGGVGEEQRACANGGAPSFSAEVNGGYKTAHGKGGYVALEWRKPGPLFILLGLISAIVPTPAALWFLQDRVLADFFDFLPLALTTSLPILAILLIAFVLNRAQDKTVPVLLGTSICIALTIALVALPVLWVFLPDPSALRTLIGPDTLPSHFEPLFQHHSTLVMTGFVALGLWMMMATFVGLQLLRYIGMELVKP